MYPALGNIRGKCHQNAGAGGGSDQVPQRVTMATAILHQERPTMTALSEAVEIYCVKSKAKTASKDIEAVTMKNGRLTTRAVCVECGTKKFRIGVLP